MDRARKLVADTYEFAARHPEVWGYIESLAKSDYDACELMSINRYVNLARNEYKVASSDGKRPGMANAMAPVLSRMLVRRHPEYRPCIRINPSMVDRVFADELFIAMLEGAA